MTSITYKKAGVDIAAGDKIAKVARDLASGFKKNGMVSDIGLFAGLFKVNWKKYKNPLLVACTDGVGTKVKLAQALNRHKTIGQDLVAMNVNDLITCGASPLFFLDYIGCHKVELPVIKKILKSITAACKNSGCTLIGGETAEMPDIYAEGEYDLVGFAVGIVEKEKIIDGRQIKPGDVLIGLASSGLHSNGYTLARKLVAGNLHQKFGSKTIAEILLEPTRLYPKLISELTSNFKIKGIAHITGGGITGNLPRIFPDGCGAVINKKSWTVPEIFKYLQEKGRISEKEMFKTFNLGIGLIIVAGKKEASKISGWLKKKREKYFIIGKITKGEKGVWLI
jgi:phosphoribosylformylglycinamidine cyclo-ligase